ncbi:hypothetical protein EXU48_06350 [Occultella glacieicola]|uniref:Uncharacterized protein n=1 Tax=Occultella glacieicola TaxID=2518684 RepID=A0ABY2E740_9MICO|nr:hypothetical protein [Occultella glacieicola]TDE95878.1 hypothetical protein EXU48_06350 [Occultella glacieicola]
MTESVSERDPERVGAHQAALEVSGPLTLAVRILRIPAVLYGLVPVVPLIGVAAIAAGAQGWTRPILLALAVAGAVFTAVFLHRVRQYWRAAEDKASLAAQFVGLFDVMEVSAEILARISALAERGGLRLMRRLRALWRVVTIPDHVNSHIESFDRARWFVPPAIGETVGLLTINLWFSVGAWVAFLILLPLRAAGTL